MAAQTAEQRIREAEQRFAEYERHADAEMRRRIALAPWWTRWMSLRIRDVIDIVRGKGERPRSA